MTVKEAWQSIMAPLCASISPHFRDYIWNLFHKAFLKTEISRSCNSWHISVGMLSPCHQVERAEVDAVVTVRLVERRQGRREAMEGYVCSRPGCRLLYFAPGEPCLRPSGWAQAQTWSLLFVPHSSKLRTSVSYDLWNSDTFCLIICVQLL